MALHRKLLKQSHCIFHRIHRGYKRLPNRQKALFWIIVLAIFTVSVPATIQQQRATPRPAKLYFMDIPRQPVVGQTFPVELRLQTTGTPINAVQTTLRFNPLYLEVVNMTTEKSFCSYYLENTFDNMKGTIRLACGTPNPGFLGDSVVVRVNLRAKISGNIDVSVVEKDTDVLANDGKGTSVLHGVPKLPLTITHIF